MQVAVKDIKGNDVKSIDLPDSIYGLELNDRNDHVLHHVVKAYQANRRQGTHATKTRSTVNGGGKKPFRQKGTGNARQGTSRSPHYPGGAVAHGPQPRDYTQKVNRKTKLLALKIALSDKVRHGKFKVVDKWAIDSYSTKNLMGALTALDAQHALLSGSESTDFLYKSSRNINGATTVTPSELNVEDVLRYQNFVISEEALEALNKRLGGAK